MKKNLILTSVVLAGLFFVMPDSSFAAGSIQAGVAAAVKGEVKVTTPPATAAHLLKSGEKVFMGDKIETGTDGQLQILLLDQTFVTLGSSSEITVDEFVYDPANDDGKVKASVIKGIFRIVSGRIAHKKPEHMSVDLPAGSIGFRGTIVVGKSEGMRSLVVLLGPSEAEGTNPGRIFVSNTVNGEEVGVEIDQKGYGTVIEGLNTAPVPAFKIPEDKLSLITGALNGPGIGKGQGSSGQAGVAPSATFDPQDEPQTLSMMSKMDEYAQRAAQGGMLTPPQPVVPTVIGGGRDDDNQRNKNS